jgi:L-fuconolactonase
MIIDSHTHFYDPARAEGILWPPAGSPLYRTVLPEHFKAVATPAGVTGTVVVEASPLLEDNQFILDLAENEPALVGFIGNLDLRDEKFSEHLDRFSAHTKFRGIRARGFSIEELMSGPEMKNLEYLSSKGLTLDLMVKPTTLGQACDFATRLPNLNIVVDHIAHVPIDGYAPNSMWRDGIQRLSRHPKVYCKLSRLTESATEWPASKSPKYYRPTIEVLWETFGPERLPWGSNWPVTELASDYATNLSIVLPFLEDKSDEDRESVLWKASKNAYGWIE